MICGKPFSSLSELMMQYQDISWAACRCHAMKATKSQRYRKKTKHVEQRARTSCFTSEPPLGAGRSVRKQHITNQLLCNHTISLIFVFYHPHRGNAAAFSYYKVMKLVINAAIPRGNIQWLIWNYSYYFLYQTNNVWPNCVLVDGNYARHHKQKQLCLNSLIYYDDIIVVSSAAFCTLTLDE